MHNALQSLGFYAQCFSQSVANSVGDAPTPDIADDRRLSARRTANLISAYILPAVRQAMPDGGAGLESAVARLHQAGESPTTIPQRCEDCPASRKVDFLAEALASLIRAQGGVS